VGFFSRTLDVITDTIGDTVEGAGRGLLDVVESAGDALLGERGTRGSTIGGAIGAFVGDAPGAAFGAKIGQAVSDDIGAGAPELRQDARNALIRNAQMEPRTAGFPAAVTTQGARTANRRMTASDIAFDTGTVIDIRYPRNEGRVMEENGGFFEDVLDFVGLGGDDSPGMDAGIGVCRPARSKMFSYDMRNNCLRITRRQQAKLREAIRLFGADAVAKQQGLTRNQMLELMSKTFGRRRRGISAADIRAVKRVDRQMYQVSCALADVKTTARANTAGRKPATRKC
jgi:hypothetical protein